ncbi:MAG: heme-binding domain-containing protein, partial [Planctomycetaceae bacterium]|nr:heme-binding domain-containing protein [Planctomycetaceae bacterium]
MMDVNVDQPIKKTRLVMKTIAYYLLMCFVCLSLFPGIAARADEIAQSFGVPAATQQVLERNCVSCHGKETEEGNVRLDGVGNLSLHDQLDLLNRVQEQLFLGEMPPEKAKQPNEADRKILLQWLNSQLTGKAAKALAEKLRRFEYG